MKHLLIPLAITWSVLSCGQHLGNFNNQAESMNISRANIATSAQGNAFVGNNRQPVYNLNPSNILVHHLKALYNVEATDYTAVFNINQIGNTAQETTQLMNDKMELIKKTLKSEGFQGKFAVDMISFVPQYEIEVTKKLFSKTYTEVPTGFELQQNLLISYNNDAQFQNIVSACAAAEVYNLVKVDYYIRNLEAIYVELQQKILAEVAKKKDYYTALGFDMDLYGVEMADRKYYHMPKDFYKSYIAAENISMDALKDQKAVVKIKKPTSYYYDAISYNGYDVVVNAGINKPVIQLGMDLTLRYILKPVKPEPKPVPAPLKTPAPKVYVVSPNGPIDIKQIPDN
jgi:hypothetical protein